MHACIGEGYFYAQIVDALMASRIRNFQSDNKITSNRFHHAISKLIEVYSSFISYIKYSRFDLSTHYCYHGWTIICIAVHKHEYQTR